MAALKNQKRSKTGNKTFRTHFDWMIYATFDFLSGHKSPHAVHNRRYKLPGGTGRKDGKEGRPVADSFNGQVWPTHRSLRDSVICQWRTIRRRWEKEETPQTRRQGTQSLSLSLQTSEEDFPDEFMTVNLATNQSRNRLVNEMENCFLVSLKLTFDGFPSPRLESPPWSKRSYWSADVLAGDGVTLNEEFPNCSE